MSNIPTSHDRQDLTTESRSHMIHTAALFVCSAPLQGNSTPSLTKPFDSSDLAQ
jgi:hypothetical protein